jgi:AbrB family looped-hinge helix DNA binding protein
MARIRVRAKGQLTLPEDLRIAAHLSEGSVFDVELTDEGILLRPEKVIDASQAWFWALDWHDGEREADADSAAGRGESFDSAELFMESLRSGSELAKRRRKAK